MSIFTFINRCSLVLCLLMFISLKNYGQRIYANQQDNGRSGLVCVNCVVNNAAAAVDGNPQTNSVINVVVGVLAQTWQEVIFNGPVKPTAGTPVRLKLGTGDNLADLTVLGSVSLRAYNNNTPVGPSYSLGTLVSAASNNNQVDVGFTPTGTYDRVRITLNGGLLGALSSLYVYEAYFNGPAAAPCNTAIDELHGISSALLGLGINIGGVENPLNAIDGNTNTASRLNAGVAALGAYAQQTIIYQSPSVVGDSIRLTLAIPQALLNVDVLSRIEISTARGNFSNNDTRTLSSSLLTLRLLDLEGTRRRVTVTYAPAAVFDRVQLRLGGGIADVLSSLDLYEAERLIRRPVINYNDALIPDNNVQACAGSTVTLTATPVANTTFTWYDAPTGGNVLTTGTSYTTPVLNASTTVYVAASRAGCTDQSERTAVTITINNIPDAPVVTNASISVCPGQQATFTVQPITGITIRWYTTPTGGTPVFTGNTFTTTAINAVANYYAEAVAGGTCVSITRTQVTATPSAIPDAPTLSDAAVSICSGQVATLSVASPAAGMIYRWYTTPTGGAPIYTGNSFTTAALTANAIYYVEAENTTGCTSTTRATATVTVNPLPDAPQLAANNLTINAGQTATINVSNAQTGVTYNWYTSASAGTPVFTGAAFTTPELYNNTSYYVEAVNAAGCPSASRTSVTISVTVVNPPCSFANQQSSNISGLCIGCGVSNRPRAIDADTTTASRISVIAGLLGAYAEQIVDFQQPGFAGDTIRFVVQSPVGLADVGVLARIEVALYNGATEVVRYNADNALVKLRLLGGGNRYAISIPAPAGYNRASIRLNTGLASLISSIDLFYVAQQYPAPVFSNPAPEICNGSTAQINITSPSAGTFTWYDAPTGGNVVFTGTNFTTPELTTTTTYYVENTRGTCPGNRRYPVQILVNDPPAAPVVTPASASIFSGQTTTFTASAGNNVTIRWYDQPTGGNLVHTGTTFTTDPLSASTIFYAESSIGDCVNPTRTPAPVNVTAVTIPDVAVTPPTQTINEGESATLTASSTTPGTTFNWYTTATGGTSIFTGPIFNTPALDDNAIYYAEAVVTATGSRSATRASGSITVNDIADSPVPCDAAIAQTTDINGLVCLGCTVTNPGRAIDGDANSFSRLNVAVGLLNAYAQQTLRFANTGHAGDSVILNLGIPGTLANVNVLSQISVATYNGATYNGDRFNVNSSLITIRLLAGTSRFRVAFAPGADFDRVEIRLNSAIAGVFDALNIYAASQSVPAPTIAASSVTVCAGTQATLTATVPGHVTVRWYTSATGGTPVFTGNTFNTPVLNASATYYAEASRTSSNCAQSERTPVNVSVTPTPVAPVVTTPTVTVCAGNPATFTAQAVPGVTFSWYTAPTGGTPVFTGASFTTPDLTETTSYYVEATAGTCGSSARTQVTANVTTTPMVPQVSQTPVATCSGSTAVLSATSTQPGVTFRWYTTATGGTPVFTGAQFTTPELTADATYYVEAGLGDCVSATRAAAEVDVNPLPANPTVTVNPTGGQVLAGETATITATSSTAGATFRWYTTATGGTPIFTGATYTTPPLSSTTTYYVEARLAATGCVSAQRTAVTITVNPTFSTDCDFANGQTSDVNGGVLCVGCGVTDDGNAVNPDTTDFSQLNLPIAVAGSYVSQTLIFPNGGIVGDTVTLKIRIPVALVSASVLDRIQIASYNGAGTYNNDRINLSSNLIRLQLLGGGETAYVKFAPGSAFDRIEIRLNSVLLGVFNTLDVFYATNQVELPQVDATTVNICSGGEATFTVSNPRTGVIYNWYNTPTGGTPLFTGESYTTDPLTATTTFYVESMRDANDCPNPNRVAVTANVTPTPDVPTLSQNSATICAGESVTFTVTNAAGGTVRWYNAATNGTLLFTGASYTTSPVTTANYYAEISNGDCASPGRATATVTVNPRPARPNVQAANVQVCSGSAAILRVQTPQAGVTYTWYNAATGGTVQGTGAELTTDPLTASAIYYVEASNTATGCINNGGRRRVDVTVTATPDAPTLSATATTVCNGGDVTISVNNPVAGVTYRWYTTATAGAAVFTGTTFTVNDVTADATYFVEAVVGTDCASSTRTQTTITVEPIPSAPDIDLAGSGNSVCAGSSATLNIVNPQAGLTYRWYNAATNGTLLFTGTSYTTGPITANTTFYVEAMGNGGGCTSSTRASITVNATTPPTTPVVTAADVDVCAGSTATLSIASPVAGVTYNWYADAGRANLLGSGNTFETPVINSNSTFYVEAVSGQCVSNATAMVDVSVSSAPTAPAVANATPATCSNQAITLSVSNPDPDFTYRWYANAMGGAALSTGSTYTVTITATTTYYVEAVNETGCSSTTRTAVTVTVNETPQAPQLTTQGAAICPGSTATLTVTAQTGVTVNWYDAQAGGTLVASGNSFTTGVLNTGATYYAEAVADGSGCLSTTRTAAVVTILQPLDAPVVTAGATTNTSVSFNWNSVMGAVSYDVSTDNGQTFTNVGSTTTHTISNLVPNTEVSLIVRAIGNADCQQSENSNRATNTSVANGVIFVPNAFTPNGDGNNDVLYVYSSSIQSLTFYVYDQWGEMIFRSTNQANGWDGTFKGNRMPVGVYVYYMEATTTDGQKINKKGSITLLR